MYRSPTLVNRRFFARMFAPLITFLALAGWVTATLAAPVVTGSWQHALAAYQQPKYPPDYHHFGYVDPDAPKGGLLRLANPDRRTSARSTSK